MSGRPGNLLRGRTGLILARHLIACFLVVGALMVLPLGSYALGTRLLLIAALAGVLCTLVVLTVRDLRRGRS
ncbi:hypothetical protein OG897_40220 [Streptomyces sp. NBC_00237]|uniref:hypothetical protein n=1 Tax=Streptomyces sp. NBC_00237 TaxID=2975687 RepID=UPI00225179D9|nr:hypothetical protein [Streptomyces sp. NBC_00237]MCX5207619.1 hypothetical protein [Streptomyces sp. NBC_00237]